MVSSTVDIDSQIICKVNSYTRIVIYTISGQPKMVNSSLKNNQEQFIKIPQGSEVL